MLSEQSHQHVDMHSAVNFDIFTLGFVEMDPR